MEELWSNIDGFNDKYLVSSLDRIKIQANTSNLHDKRPVYQIDKTTDEIIKSFDSITQATRETGVLHISAVCLGNRHTAGGFKWEYKK